MAAVKYFKALHIKNLHLKYCAYVNRATGCSKSSNSHVSV